MVTPAPTRAEVARGPWALAGLVLLAATLFSAFVALGTWQVERLAWKRALIARVEQRVHAPPVAAPAPADWAQMTAADEYRHVRLLGTFLYDRETLVRANTRFGPGYWVMTPLRTGEGAIVLVNRGFVPPDGCGREARCALGPAGEIPVSGLVRLSETANFLRPNDPAHDNWHARDVAAIARARGLVEVAPYFVDADAVAPAASTPAWPRGGLTVVAFPNSHLAYLLTWYLLALMVAAGAVGVGYDEHRRRRLARAGQGASTGPGSGAA